MSKTQDNEKANKLLNKYTNKRDTEKTHKNGEVREDWRTSDGVSVDRPRGLFRWLTHTKKLLLFVV